MSVDLAYALAQHAAEPERSVAAGVVIGIVTDNYDKDGLGRVNVKFPWLNGVNVSAWARVSTPMAGKDFGVYFLPEIEDEVLVMFLQGDVRFPYVIGSLWNGKDKAPADNSDKKNNLRVIRSRRGHVIKLNDEAGAETIEVIDASGKNSIVIDTKENTITISAEKDIVLKAPMGAIKLNAQTIELHSTKDSTITADAGMTVHATKDVFVSGNSVNLN